MKKSGGRNNHGHVTSRRRGGGHKQQYRKIDFKRDKFGMPGKVAEIEYDPNRSARIALMVYADGEKRYILHPGGLKQGDRWSRGPGTDARTGNALPLGEIPLGTTVHNIELKIGKGGQSRARPARAPRSWPRKATTSPCACARPRCGWCTADCLATIGEVGNAEHELLSVGKAGKTRWLGRGPKVRGVAMNPVDHPLGGGEGKSSGGRPPVSPWGKPEGGKTRKRKKASNRLIVRGRKRGKATQVMACGASRRARSFRRRCSQVQILNSQEREAGGEDLEPGEHDHPRVRGPHLRGAQREQVRPGVRDREHGGAQAGRVLADAALPGHSGKLVADKKAKPE